jgi:signal transduction histidine kinase
VNNRVIDTFRRFQLSFWIGFVIIGFFLSSTGILYLLATASASKAREIRSEIGDRDLRELVGRLDSDERYVLEHNIDQLVDETREVTPLLLPRQYYVGLPPNYLRVSPRQPPLNCFVELTPENPINAKQLAPADKVCAYFAENSALGSYLFLAADVYDNAVVPLKSGDISLSADALKMTIARGERRATWWLTLQPPRERSTRGRFEINAVRENTDGTRERDKRVEGWAYAQRQGDGSQIVHFIARVDFKEFAPELTQDIDVEQWPPEHWESIHLRFARKDMAEPGGPAQLISYRPHGRAQLSLVSLADSIFDSYSELAIQHTLPSGQVKTWNIVPAAPRKDDWHTADGYIRKINGDLVIGKEKMPDKILPDTNLRFIVAHPGIIFERVVWQSFLALLMVFVVGFIFAVYFYRNLLKPIFTLTRRIHHLVEQPTSDDQRLPYAEQRNELGTLARGFNELLAETRRRVVRDLEQQRARQAVEERQRKDAIQIREENMKLIGHEIRSPLQSLLSLHYSDSRSRPFLDRMHKALEYLQATLHAQQAISEREPDLKEVDIAPFLKLLAESAPLAMIDNVAYSGPEQGIWCIIDTESMEDAITHILKNANRFRIPSTPIQLGLSHEDQYAIVAIANQGPCIGDENLERIFDFGMSTTPKTEESGNGFGLYVARQYLLLMHGTIDVRNLDDGVCFEIKLPLRLKNESFVEVGTLSGTT